jgi:hypothetical protein
MTTIYGVKKYYDWDQSQYIGYFFKKEKAQDLIDSKEAEELVNAEQRLQEYKKSLSSEEFAHFEKLFKIAKRLQNYFEYLHSKKKVLFENHKEYRTAFRISNEYPNVVLYKSYINNQTRLENLFEEKYNHSIWEFSDIFDVEKYIQTSYALHDIEVE